MKKITSLILAVLLPLGACACAEDATGSIDISSTVSSKPAGTTSKYAIEVPSAPQRAPYPDEESFFQPGGTFDSEGFQQVWEAWNRDEEERRAQAERYEGLLDDYLKKTAETFLTPKEPGKNAACSPINIWLAFAMAAETAGGSTRRRRCAPRRRSG